MKAKALFLVLTIVFLLACGVSSEQMTATAVAGQAQTQTAAPTKTATPTVASTSTPRPTATSLPTETPVPAPAAVGETVQYRSLEITLLKVETHTQIVTGGAYYYYAKPGEIFVDVAVLVRNNGDIAGQAKVQLKEIYLFEETGAVWYPNFNAIKSVELEKKFDPMSALKLEKTYSGIAAVNFEKDTYLRLVYYVKKDQNLLFGIRDWAQFAFSVE